jgi:hypothetical protein
MSAKKPKSIISCDSMYLSNLDTRAPLCPVAVCSSANP